MGADAEGEAVRFLEGLGAHADPAVRGPAGQLLRRRAERVQVDVGPWGAGAMPRLFAGADAFALPSRGEVRLCAGGGELSRFPLPPPPPQRAPFFPEGLPAPASADSCEDPFPPLPPSAPPALLPQGWGLPIMEALAMGLPVVATDFGGSRDFLRRGAPNAFPVEVAELEAAEAGRPGRWARPDMGSLTRQMRAAREQGRERGREQGREARGLLLREFGGAAGVNEAAARLANVERVGGRAEVAARRARRRKAGGRKGGAGGGGRHL